MVAEMENPFSVIPHHDPYYDFSLSDQVLKVDQNPSLGFHELPPIGEPNSCTAFVSQSEVSFRDDIESLWDVDDPLSDPFIQQIINEPSLDVAVYCGADASGNNGESVGEGNVMNSQIPLGLGTGNQVQQSVSPVPLSPSSCSCCHILREIIHVNGKLVKILEIHGRVGIISHAVLDKYILDSSSENHEYQMFDFCNESMGSVKAFLVQYSEDCSQEGYNMLQDPLSNFYEALCVGYNENLDIACNKFLQSSPVVSGDLQMNPLNLASQEDESSGTRPSRSDGQTIHSQHEAEINTASSSRSFLATQRERTGKMKLKDFSAYFHLPIHEAAKKMNVCPTVIKKKCRQGGLPRWPYRKIKGIKRKISKIQENLKAGTVEEKACAAADVRILEQELENIFAKFSC